MEVDGGLNQKNSSMRNKRLHISSEAELVKVEVSERVTELHKHRS